MPPLCDFIPDELTRPPAAPPRPVSTHIEETPRPTVFSRILHWWRNRDKSRRALAKLEDSEIGNLSELGRKLRLEERRARKSADAAGP